VIAIPSQYDDVHPLSAQTSLGGILGGKLAFYTMITLRGRQQKWKRRQCFSTQGSQIRVCSSPGWSRRGLLPSLGSAPVNIAPSAPKLLH
jgi:hypothetical protein